MNSKEDSPTPAATSSKAICLKVRKLGHVASFKNCKRIFRGKMVTDPSVQSQMELITQSLQLQLRSLSATNGAETLTEEQRRCLTALFTHSKDFDDNWTWLPQIRIQGVLAEKGDEGASMEIELLNH